MLILSVLSLRTSELCVVYIPKPSLSVDFEPPTDGIVLYSDICKVV